MAKNINVRQNIFDNGTKNPYYEGELCGRDREFVKGFDTCAEKHIEGFFENIYAYADEFEKIGIDVYSLDIVSVNADELDESFIGKLDKNTVLFGTIHDCLLDYIERQRNITVIDMIDAQREKR